MWQSMACHEFNEEIHKDAAILIIKVLASKILELRTGFAVLNINGWLYVFVVKGVLDAEKSYLEKMHDSSHKAGEQCPEFSKWSTLFCCKGEVQNYVSFLCRLQVDLVSIFWSLLLQLT